MEDERAAKVVLLGTGTPNAEPERSGPSVAVIANGKPYIVDFGPGVVRRAQAAYEAGVNALHVNNLIIAFLTHLHSDHTAGYPDLIFTPWVLNRDEPFEVYGPPGLINMTNHIMAAYQDDVNERINGLQPANTRGYIVNAYEVEPGIVYKDSNVTIEAFPVNHGSWRAYGFKFTSRERVITISGDTAPASKLAKYYRGSDVLIHEVYSVAGFAKYPPAWRKYHSQVHTSAHELGDIASEVRPKLLVLYHQLYNGFSDEQLIAEVRERYDGDVVSGKDLDII